MRLNEKVAPGRQGPADAKPGFSRFPLRLKTVAYQIGDDGKKTVVPSYSNVWGNHATGCTELFRCEEESLDFYLNIPIDSAVAISELRELDEKMEALRPWHLSPEERKQAEEHVHDLEKNPEELADVVRQYRLGHFIVECRVMAPEDLTSGNELELPDPARDNLWAKGQVELEVVFKGRAFDKLLDDPQPRR